MQAILYTDTDQIRSVLGLDGRDASDSQLMVRNLKTELRLDLTGWLSDHATLYENGTTGTPTQDEVDIADSISLYCTYTAALLVVPSLQLLAKQSVSDGKNTLERFTPVGWENLIARLTERAQFYKSLLQEGIGSSVIVASSPQLIGAGLAIDPVTGV